MSKLRRSPGQASEAAARRRIAPALAAAVLSCGLSACGPSEPGSVALPVGGVEDHRYRLDVRVRGADGARPGALLTVRVEPRQGWHLAPDATARLALEGPGGVEFLPASQTGETAVAFDREVLEFAAELRRGERGDARAKGQLKFGVCKGDDTSCAIVRRELDLLLPGGTPGSY